MPSMTAASSATGSAVAAKTSHLAVPGPRRVFLGIATGQTEARTDAELARYDVLIVQAWEYGRIAGVKAINPAAKFLAYKDSTGILSAADSGSGLWASGVTKTEADANPSWYLVDATTGLPVVFDDFSTTYFANQGNAGYQARWISNVITELQTNGFDGVFADDVNADYSHHYSGNLQDPAGATHDVLSQSQYAAFTRSMLVACQPAFRAAGLLFVCNIANSVDITTWTDWITLVDGATREFYTKFGTADSTNNTPVYPAGVNTRFIDPDWSNEIPPFQQAANAAGNGFLPIIYSVVADTKSKRYARASFLLDWDNSKSLLSGLCWDDSGHPTTDSYSSDWAIAIGTPLGPKYNVDGGTSWYARRFTNGYVVLNATNAAHTFDLTGSSLLTQAGVAAGSSMSIGAAEAHIFTGTPPGQPTVPFGKTTVGGSWNNNGADTKQAVKFSLSYDDQLITKLTAYVDGNGPGSIAQNVRGVIYSDLSGAPDRKLGVTAEVSIAHAQAAGWVDFTFSSPMALDAGTYWLGLQMSFADGSGASRWAYDTGTSNQWAFLSESYAAGTADPFGSASFGNVAFSIYASPITPPNTGSMVPA